MTRRTRPGEAGSRRTRSEVPLSPGRLKPSQIQQRLVALGGRLEGVPLDTLPKATQQLLDNLVVTLQGLFDSLSLQVGFLDERAGSAASSPAVTTDNGIARWDGTVGRVLQDSDVTVADNTDIVLNGQLSGTSPTIRLRGPTGTGGVGFIRGGSDTGDAKISLRDDAAILPHADQGFTFSNHTSGTNYAQIDFNGQLSVGKKNPSTNLHVYEDNSDTAPTARIEQDGTGDAALQFLLTGGESFSIGIDNSDSDKFKISDNSSLGTNDRFVIEADGDVEIDGTTFHVDATNNRIGIGTASPARILSVRDTSANPFIEVVSSTSGTAGLLLGDTDNGARGQVKYDNSADSLLFFTSGNERVHVDSSGNVGVGLTPSGKLDVDGEIILKDGMTAPAATSGKAKLFVDTADGDLKVIFGDGTTKTIVTDT